MILIISLLIAVVTFITLKLFIGTKLSDIYNTVFYKYVYTIVLVLVMVVSLPYVQGVNNSMFRGDVVYVEEKQTFDLIKAFNTNSTLTKAMLSIKLAGDTRPVDGGVLMYLDDGAPILIKQEKDCITINLKNSSKDIAHIFSLINNSENFRCVILEDIIRVSEVK